MLHRRLLASIAAVTLLIPVAAPTFAQDAPEPPPEATASPVAQDSPAPPEAASSPVAPAPPVATPNPVALEAPAGDGTAVRLTTDLGDIVIGLFNESAPVAAENFLNLASSGFYDGVGFHRAVPGFVLQGGDPEESGGGGPGYTIEDEEVVGEYGRGIVAMARTQQPNSQGSQFFIVLDDAAKGSLDAARTYAIFGRVVEGMDVVDAIVGARPPSDRIEDPVEIISASIEQVELPPEPSPPPPTPADLAAADLAALVPGTIGSLTLSGESFTSEEVFGGFADEQLQSDLTSLAEANGADIGLLSVATGGASEGDSFVTLVGGSIPDVPADQAQDAMVRLLLGDTSSSNVTQETVAGREVSVVRATEDAGPEQTVYIVPSGDVVWLLAADPATLEAAITALP